MLVVLFRLCFEMFILANLQTLDCFLLQEKRLLNTVHEFSPSVCFVQLNINR
eukprot:m.269491 g.269491  ORF g.269491 m.269491 type:complete len:52 (+) comp78347_c0_seq1:70-225(+)